MNRDLDLGNIGKYLDAYDRHAGDENKQNGFAFAMLKECYPEEESYDTAKRRFFATEGKSTQDVYAYFRKLYDDYKGDFGNGKVKRYADKPESFTAEQENEFLRKHPYQAFLKTTRDLPQNVRDTAFGIVFAEGSRPNVSEAFADKLLAMPENERNAALWGAYVLSPETSSNFFKRIGNRLLENLGDNSFNISSYWEQSQKGVNPHTIYDAVAELDALGEDGKIKPEKLAALNKKLNELRGENSIFNEESSQVYGEKIRNAVRRNIWEADKKEYTSDFIEAEYKKGKRAKDTFSLVSQLRNIIRTRYEKRNIVAQTLEDATVVGVEMLKYVGASAVGMAFTKNPWMSASLVGAVMYSEFKPQMFNALRHEGNMSVDDANKYANFATAGMIAANYIGYTRWIKAIKPSSYLLGTEITKANARDYFFHAIAEMPKTFVREGLTETASEYMESVVEYATKSWVADHEGATFEQKELWDNFCQDFLDTTRIMPTLMFGSTLLGGGLAVNKIRRDSGAGLNLKQLISPAEVVNHQVQARAAMAQADEAVLKAGESLGEKSTAYDFVRKYREAKTDEERVSLLSERFGTEEERANAKAALENVDKLNDEVTRTFAQMLADAAKQNAEETERLYGENQAIDGVFDEAENSQKGSPKFKIVEELLDRLDARDSVVEVNSAADLERVGYSAEKAQSIMDSMGRKGFFSANDGKIYMLPAHFENGVDAFRTFVHERGHWLAQKIKDTPEYAGMLQRIVQITGGEQVLRSLLPSSYANNDVSVAAEEYLMRVVERVALEDVLNANQRGVWNFFKAKLKKWFGGDKTLATMRDRELAEMARSIYRRATAPEEQEPANRWEVFTPENNGKPASGIWQVVDADALITSTDKGYDDKLQPRNRQRKGSEIQTTEIATNLNPALLGNSAKSSDGAPIVDSRGMVISGNGRTLAIRKAYEAEKTERAQAYKDFVSEQAKRLGLDVPANIKKPMLVRRVDDLGGMSMEEFAARSNKSDLAKMSNAENAIADARRILDAHLLDSFFPSDNGDVLAASNNDFITGFLDIIGGREEYIDKHGARKPNLAPRIKSAVLAAMLNPEKRDIIENLLDNPQGWSGLINGLFGSVANLAKLDGNADYNLADELSKAVEIFVGLQRAGESVATFNAQGDMFNEPISDEVGFLIELFEKNARTPTGISGVLNEYYNLVKGIDTTTQDMFGAENPSKIDELRAAYQKYSTSLAEEPNVSWRNEENSPTPEEIRETQRQKDEVKAKWTNPDGTMKKGYHCAPNGKPSRLTEEQWLWVRTPNFKKWFGDWETLAEAYPENEIFDIDEAYKFARKNLQGGSFTSKDGYGATLGREGIDKMNSGLARGKTANNRLHALAFANIGKLFGNSELLETEPPRDGNTNIKRYLKFYAPLYMDGLYAVKITVKELSGNNGNRLYSIEGLDITKESEYRGQSRGSKENSIPADYSDSVGNFVKKLREVKGNVSQVVDENGEPLVVYHGTENGGFTVFDKDLIASEGGFYFNDRKAVADEYAATPDEYEPLGENKVYAVFLNIRNPYIKDFKGERYNEFWTEMDVVKEEGYDGFIAKNIIDNRFSDSENTIPSTDYVVLNSNQIKSATDNVGTYSKNPDIRWSIRGDSEIEKINRQFRDLYERYKGGDQAAYGEAVRMVADYAKSKGYDVKVYHGTGSDGFNVAKADASEAKYGEGYQAHGMGLYLATSKSTSERYRKQASKSQKLVYLDHEKYEHVSIAFDKLSEKTQKYLTGRFDRWRGKTLDELEKQLRDTQRQVEELSADKEKFGAFMRTVFANAKAEVSALKEFIPYIKENKLEPAFFATQDGEGKLFDWFTNLKPENVLDEDKTLKEQNEEIQKKFKKAFDEDILPFLKESYGFDEDEFASAKQAFDFNKGVRSIVSKAKSYVGAHKFNEIMLKHGIKGITYNGGFDGRCYVSFEGGSAVKLQDPFTFDDNGELIPLTERFDVDNPDMRWRDVEEQIKTPQFKAWFGKSQVVDKDGMPLRVYHGTTNVNPDYSNFDVFKGKYHFFSSDKDVAGSMGSIVYTCFLRIENPLIIDAGGNEWGAVKDHTGGKVKFADLTSAQKKKLCKAFDFTAEELESSYSPEEEIDLVQARVIKRDERSTNEWAEYAKANGYDGVIFKNLRDGAGIDIMQKTSDVFVVFKSNQIKDATGENNGDFSNENPSIKWKDDTKAEADAWARNPENVRKAAEQYLSKQKGQIIVDPDEIRKLVPNYEVSNNSLFVGAGDEILEVVWAEALKKAPKDKPVVLLTGNPAAGKGTARARGLLSCIDTAGIVFDAPQNGFESVEKRVREAVDSGHNVQLVQIYNNPITSWQNAINRGIGKNIQKTGTRDGGRFLPLKYFVERAYERAQGKVKKIEGKLKSTYGRKLETIYIDSSRNNPKIVPSEEAKAWDYSINKEQLEKLEEITYENIGRIEESARLRGDKKNPLAVITSGLPQTLEYRNVSFRRIFPEGISGGNESGNGRNKFGVEPEGTDGNESRLRFLLRQERTENPVIWASIVLAKEILSGRGITRTKVEKVLPTAQFDGSKQNYAVERAKRIAEKTKATQKEFAKNLDLAIRKAETNLYWQDEFVENAYRAFSKGGEEYGFAKQRLMQYLKDLKNKELNKVKGYETDDFDVDLVDAILKAQEAEPERAAGDESKPAGEEPEEELEESSGAFEGDEEFSGGKTPLAPSKIRDVIGAIRREVVRRVRDSDGDQKTLDEKYRRTLVNVLTDAMKELVYGKEREDIGKKIEELKNVKHAVITVKDGERVGQKIDNFTLRAENIALRIFKRGVRDSKKAMTEKLNAILERRGKKPSRMQRDDKRGMTGLAQQRIYNISKYVEMDAESLENVRREAIAKLEDVDGNFVQDAEKGKIREDVEDVRAELENVLHDLEMFGGWADKSRAGMAQALEFLENTIDTETAAQRERVEQRKKRNAAVRKTISDALKMSEHNAARDGGMRVAIRKVLNGSLPFDSFLGLLGESATGETRKLFEEWRKDFVARIDRAANAKANEVFQMQQRFIKLVEDSYSTDFHDALKRLLEKKGEYEKFSKPVDGMRQPMSLANVIQLYVSAVQKNYERNFYEHRVRRSEKDIAEYKKLQDIIDSIRLDNIDEYAKGMLKQSREALEKRQAQMREEALADYLKSIEAVLSDGDRRFIEGLRQLYKDALPSISAVAKRVIGLPIEQADALYMPVKVKRSGNLGEGVPQVPVVPKSLSQRVPHLRDLDETADPISLFTDRISENAQFKHFSELYIEMRGIFGDGDLQDLIKQRCGADVLTGLKEFIADIATGKTRGPQNELLRKTNGLTAVMLLGFNLGSGIRQVLPGVASFAPAIGGWNVLKNMMSFFTPEGFAAAREICRSDTGRRRFEIGNMQIMEELLSTPDQNRFWALYKRHALFFNRFADKLSIMFVGQGIYRSGVGEYLRRGFSEAEAKKFAMSDMWQIAERTQASGRIHNMSHWQRRSGEYGKALGLFSSPPQLMFSMAYAKCRRALALGVKTPEGRAAVFDALSTLFYVSVCVEGSYALSGVLWNALLKGFFDDDDGEQILKQMALGPFGGLFVFGRIIEGAGSNYGTSLAPIEQLSRPIRHTKNLLFDAGQFDADKAVEDLDKLAKSLFPLYRDSRKVYENRMN